MRIRPADLQADALAFMYAHEFVEERYHEEDLTPGLEHNIQYPTRAPVSGHYIDRNQVVEAVLFATFADLHLRGSVVLMIDEAERIWGSRRLYRFLRDHLHYRREVLYAKKDGSLPSSPLYSAIDQIFEAALYPSSTYLEQPRLPVAHIIRQMLAARGRDRDPFKEIIRWVGDELIEEGFYIESTDVVVGVTPFADIRPDVEKMLTVEDRALDLKARLTRFQEKQPELYGMLKQTISRTMEELKTLYQRRTGF